MTSGFRSSSHGNSRGTRCFRELTFQVAIRTVQKTVPGLAECERVRLRAGLIERDLERPLADGVVLAHELVHAAVLEQPVAAVVDVDAVRRTRRLAVERDVERNRLP